MNVKPILLSDAMARYGHEYGWWKEVPRESANGDRRAYVDDDYLAAICRFDKKPDEPLELRIIECYMDSVDRCGKRPTWRCLAELVGRSEYLVTKVGLHLQRAGRLPVASPGRSVRKAAEAVTP
jgi:hypothetical protein